MARFDERQMACTIRCLDDGMLRDVVFFAYGPMDDDDDDDA